MTYENITDSFQVTIEYHDDCPNRLIYAAMHNDYSDVGVNMSAIPDERVCGVILVKKLLAGNRGHYGCLEHPYILLSIDTRFFIAEEWGYPGMGILSYPSYTYINLNMRNLLALLEDTKGDSGSAFNLILLEILQMWSKEIYEWYIQRRLHKHFPAAP